MSYKNDTPRFGTGFKPASPASSQGICAWTSLLLICKPIELVKEKATLLNVKLADSGVSFLYDIWQVTYPNSENSYITDDGDLLHFERTVNPGTLIDTITRLNDRQLLIPAESVGVDFGLNLGDIVRVTYIFDGSSTQDTLLGEVSATGSASGINNIEIDVISFDANNGEDIRNDPNTNIPNPFGGSVEAEWVRNVSIRVIADILAIVSIK